MHTETESQEAGEARKVYGRAATVGSHAPTFARVVEYALYAPREPVRFSW